MKEITLKVGIGNKEMEKGLEKVKELNDCLEKANKIMKELEGMGIQATVETLVPAYPNYAASTSCGCL